MDTSTIDPQVAALGASLAETAARNTAASIVAQIRAVKAKKNDKDTINELDEIVRGLIADRNEAVRIAQAFEQELVAQRLSEDDIRYIIDSVIPVLKKLIEQTAAAGGDTEAAKKMEDALDLLEPILSVETLTVLQLVGFNIKKAIGEPLTLFMQKLISSKFPMDQQAILETNRLNAELNINLLKITQDAEASERLKRVLRVWRGEDS